MRRLGTMGGAWLLAASLGVDPLLQVRPALAQAPVTADGLQLKVRRLPDAIELVVQGAGPGTAMDQRLEGPVWNGSLRTDRNRGLRAGPQTLAMPDAGMERISFDGTGREFTLRVTPLPGQNLSPPIISSDGADMIVRFPAPQLPVSQTVSPNLSRPTPVPTPAYVPPLRPRAVAPPLGDMAVGTMTIRNRGYVNLGGPPVTLTTRGAQARDVLMVLAQIGGYGFAYSDVDPAQAGNANRPPVNPVTVSFRNEPFERAFNFVLLTSGLQARREGNTIVAGPTVLSKTIGAQLSKIYRLNQVSANSAADYLANLGATVTKVTAITTAVSQGVNQTGQVAGASTTNQTTTSTQQQVEAFGATTGPLVGLQATTDPRLSTITLVGEPALVAIAEQYLKQLDLRQRQVALSVKILDVTLNNDTEIDNSFAFRFGNNFIVNDGGQLLAAFGRNLPPSSGGASPTDSPDGDFNTRQGLTRSNFSNSASDRGSSAQNSSDSSSSNVTNFTFDSSDNLSSSDLRSLINNIESTGSQVVSVDQQSTETGQTFTIGVTRSDNADTLNSNDSSLSSNLTRNISNLISRVTGSNVFTSRSSSDFSSDTSSSSSNRGRTYVGSRPRNPGLNYPDQQFFDFLRAQVVSNNTKVLAAPTLILSENPEAISGGLDASSGAQTASDTGGFNLLGQQTIGRSRSNEAFVTVGTQVPASVEVTQVEGSSNVTCELEFATAGLTFGARISKIDDNGFVTFSLSPTISAVVDEIPGPSACSSDLAILSLRRLDTGSLRVRDGQTLILTGVISDEDRQIVSKWPILGDLPFVGQFFRSTAGSKRRNELVILVTPRIIDDEQG
ncbi:MAG: secretin N-terminal domain-containing protein, partial [Synechococcus sp.]|nr:secretin N-terminal domain-containing protein [Synechococcus sp.]